ncbi:polyunsaturated fatty acid 5-lipoxygenase-like [Hemiscyllium ocellatum]|uniref:polyunsaturated fatty acid 5-lipoxygenase-like n=1 Tax=Hemiscyllium ocellatum TaxID=170820 RepID=UPI002967369F|nr:polyunsaturated fatty acid 5-lipoxygenase-like [Hemiscyllium ocellatum]
MITYNVTIETGTGLCAGTESNVFCTLIGEREKRHKASVNRWLHNELKRGTLKESMMMDLCSSVIVRMNCERNNSSIVFAKHLWKKDWFFGNQFLNGFNPVLIEKCNKIPPNFHVTDDMVRTSLRNSTLKQEIEVRSMFYVNYEILDGIPANVIEGVQQYTAAPICLLYRNEKNYMIPIAIQLKQTPGEDNPIFLPSDAEHDWMLAKMWVRSCDFQHFEMISHLLKTHLIAETFIMATLRQLPSVHSIYKLLAPHVKYTMHINTVARIKLIGNNGYISQMFGVKEDDFHLLCSKAFQRLTYRSLCLPENLKDRGVTELKGFVTGIVMYYYKEDSEIQDDSELQAWIKDLTEVGLEGIGDSEFPTSFHTRDDLCKFLTMIIFTCSAQHAALNNAQYDWGAWVPNSPCSMRKPPPTTKGIVTMEDIMESLPSLHQSCLQMAILWILNQKQWELRKLGNYNEKHFTEEKVKTIIGRFQDKLKEIADLVCDERDAKLLPRYDYLCPKNIENSITI